MTLSRRHLLAGAAAAAAGAAMPAAAVAKSGAMLSTFKFEAGGPMTERLLALGMTSKDSLSQVFRGVEITWSQHHAGWLDIKSDPCAIPRAAKIQRSTRDAQGLHPPGF